MGIINVDHTTRFFFGVGNPAFYSLLRPMGGGGFAGKFGKALTVASRGTAAIGIFNQVQDYRAGRNSGQEAAFGSAALFFGCLAGGGSLRAFAYSGLTSYLVMASLISRTDHFRATHPEAEFVRSRPSTWWKKLLGLRWPRFRRPWVEVAGFRWWVAG